MSESADYLGARESLERQCAAFSARPANERPVDQLWDYYARDPNAALDAFTRHIGSYDYIKSKGSVENGLYGKLHVAAAFAGVILASEAGDPDAEESYKSMHGSVHDLGHMILNQVASPLADTSVDGAGSALGIYLAASAADEAGHTAWKKPMRAKVQDFANRRRQRGGSSQAQTQKGHAIVNDSDHVDALGESYLKTRYRGSANRGVDNNLALLSLAYADVAQMSGALLKFFNNPNDRISAQHAEDFVGACMRLARRPHAKTEQAIYDIGAEIAVAFDHNMGRMFYTAARLLHDRGVPIKGYRGGGFSGAIATASRARDLLRTTEHKPYSRRSARPSASGSYASPGRATSSSTGRSAATPKGRPANPSETSSRIWSINSLETLYKGPLEDEIDRVSRATPKERLTYPWSGLYAALSFRRTGFMGNRSRKEDQFFDQNESPIAEYVAKQLLDNDVLGMIRNNAKELRADHLAAAMEIRSWIVRVFRGEVESQAVTRERATDLWRLVNQSLDAYLLREYGTYGAHHGPAGTPEFREALLNLGLMQKLALDANRPGDKELLQTFRYRVAGKSSSREALVRHLPSKALQQYYDLIRVS